MILNEPQVWTLIAVFSAVMIGMSTMLTTGFGRILRAEIGRVDDNIGHIRESLDRIDTRFDKLEEGMDKKLDKLEESMDKKLDKLENKIDALDARVDDLDKEVANLATKIWRGPS